MNVHLETGRLRLREFTGDDVGLLVDLDSDPDVIHYITGGSPTARSEIEDVVLPHWLDLYVTTPGFGFWAAEERATGEFVGWFHLRLRKGQPSDEPELGYRLRQRSSGRGYATEGSRALVDDAFVTRSAGRVVAETMFVNAASLRVMEKAGMRVDSVFRRDGPVPIPGDGHGDVRYAIDRAEWERQRRG
jgi:RimJ/RimL family protein N-acetyltransferase